MHDNKTLYLRYFFLVITNLFLPSAFGQKEIKIDAQQDIISLEKENILWYADETKQHKLKEISEEKFINLPTLNLGYNPAKHWFKIVLDIEKNEEILLELEGLFEVANCHIRYEKGEWISQEAGIWKDFRERKIQYRDFVFPLKFEKKGRYTIYIEMFAQASVSMNAKIYNRYSFKQHIVWQELFFGMFYGAILIILFYNLFLFFSLKDITYLYYCTFLILSFWVQFIVNGHYLYFFPHHSFWIERSNQFVFLFVAANFLLNIHFLDTKKQHKTIHKIFVVMLLLNLLLSIVGFALPIPLIVEITSLDVLLSVLIAIISATILLVKGLKEARFLVLAWTFYLIAAILLVLRNMGILPNGFVTENSLQLGTITQILLLSFALSDKINILRQERNKAEKDNQKLAEENKNILLEQNKMLEKKVLERTQELQETYEETQVMNEELRQTQEELQTQRDYVEEKNKDLEHINNKLLMGEQILRKMNDNMLKKNEKLSFFNQKISNSIKAAQTIQQALLPTEEKLRRLYTIFFLSIDQEMWYRVIFIGQLQRRITLFW